MTNGLDLTPLQISQLPDDPTKPIYLFYSINWKKSPTTTILNPKTPTVTPHETQSTTHTKKTETPYLGIDTSLLVTTTPTISMILMKSGNALLTRFLKSAKWFGASTRVTSLTNPTQTNPRLIVWTLNIALPLLFKSRSQLPPGKHSRHRRSYRHQTSLLHHQSQHLAENRSEKEKVPSHIPPPPSPPLQTNSVSPSRPHFSKQTRQNQDLSPYNPLVKSSVVKNLPQTLHQ
jgi:hypothetical protein